MLKYAEQESGQYEIRLDSSLAGDQDVITLAPKAIQNAQPLFVCTTGHPQ